MATIGDSEGFVSTPLEEKGASQKDSLILWAKRMCSSLKIQMESLKGLSRIFIDRS